MLYPALTKGPFRVSGYHDKDSKRLIGIILRPDTWAANTVYYRQDDDNYDVSIPTTFAGLYHRVKHPGKSGATEPTWATLEGGETTDGSIVWEAVNYNLMPPTETIASVTYAGTDGIVPTNTSNTTSSLQFMIPVLPTAAVATGEFTITCHIVKSNSEELDISLLFRVGER